MRDTNKIAHPLFILCVLTLIVNDWYLKTTFHNSVTGKLSDFTGLFAFPYLLSVLYPRHSNKIHIGSVLLFVLWKSEWSQPLIDVFNSFTIPINRTVDYTDYIALVCVGISYITLKSEISLSMKPIVKKAFMVVACLSFLATTLPPHTNRKYVNINREYEFPFSKRELVSRLNMVQIKEIREINKYGRNVDFDSETNVFHYHDKTDTLALLLDYKSINDQDTIRFKTSFAEIIISGNDKNSKLKLLTVYKLVPTYKDKDYRDKAIRQFEKRIIKKIKNYRDWLYGN